MDTKALKNKILQLAIEGKLVPQNENDEPVSVLLERTKKEKEQLIKDKIIKKERLLPEVTEDDELFRLPYSWKWVRFSQVLDVRDGTHDTPKYIEKGIPLITSKNINGKDIDFKNVKYISLEDHKEISKRSKVDEGDILFAMIGSIGNPVIVNQNIDFSIKNVALFKFYKNNCVNNKFLYYYLLFIQDTIKKNAKGAVQTFVSLKVLREYLFPLPPLEEQKRIVAKVDSLFKLIDELDSNKQDLLKNISDTRNKVLQLAIEGKLVPQNENDEPASVLLEKIKEEKEQLIKDKVIKKEKSLPDITEEDKLFDIPNGWEWCRLGNICRFVNGDRGKNYPSKKDLIDEGIPFINAGHLINGEISRISMNYISEEKYESLSSGKVKNNDIIYCLRGTLGKNAIVKDISKGAIASSLVIIRLILSESIDIKFLYYFINSKYELSQRNSFNNGSAQPNLSADNAKKFVIPIPPLEEQKRIISKVDAIMNYLDILENEIK
ncbi:restriction endonuclease subunit S [Clostridium perfringens]|nr:restriction endonuclease subunit S [Clostridium perfringens]